MNAADCSVGNNPLMQLNKHTQQNNQILKGNNFQQFNRNLDGASDSLSLQFKTSQKSLTNEKREYMTKFINGTNDSISNPSGVHHFDEKYIVMQNGNKYKQSVWSSQFTRNVETPTFRAAHKNDIEKYQYNHQEQHNNEFTDRALQNPNTHQANRPYGMNKGLYSRNEFSNGLMGTIPHSTNVQLNKSSLESNAEESWDRHFKDLEEEVLNISEEMNADKKEESKEKVDTETDSKNLEQYQNAFQEVWDSINQDAEDILPESLMGKEAWENEHQHFFNERMDDTKEYSFDKENDYLNNPNAYDIGCILMENGAKLSEAALSFEAAVQENPNHVDAWLKLGVVQIQNEKEINGISALEKCLELDPQNLEAMKNLAISYINEGYDISSFTMLNRWIETKHTNLLDSTNGIQLEGDQARYKINEMVTKQFLQVANKLPKADPEIQLCLGLLFYSNSEFDKTIDCFKTALTAAPNDELMWNRLGASLANSNRSEEAIQAYHKALQLKPSFVRARYNLAVSSINIGCYKEAAEQLLTALSMHEVEGVNESLLLNKGSGNNDNILETLKRAFIAMKRQDLLKHVHTGMNLNEFRGEFQF